MNLKKLFYFLLVLALAMGTVSVASAGTPPTADEAVPGVGGGAVDGPAPVKPAQPVLTGVTLWDNGPLVTHPGGGFGGADASALQSALGMSVYGFGHQKVYGYRVADEFVVGDAAGWTIENVTFFAYQTTGGTSCTYINEVNFQIWDGPPDDPGSHVVFGDTTTNRLTSKIWSGIYRVLDTAMTNTDRAICSDVASAGVWLAPGDYWLDWQTGGTLSSGPWAPPITIVGQTTTGNAKQFTTAWDDLVDSGTLTPQGLPFIVSGTVGGAQPTMHVHSITFAQIGTKLTANVFIMDDAGAGVAGAAVTIEVTGPIPPISRTATTNAAGKARFNGPARSGTWTVCVTDVVKAGLLYDPTQNLETCDSFTVP